MINISVLSTGSKGNAYLIHDENINILLDCGISWKDIQIKTSFIPIDYCFISHQHNDHCKAVRQVLKHGITAFMTRQMAEDKHLEGHNVKKCTHGTDIILRHNWRARCFALQHDVANLGYMLQKTGEGRVVYITDTMYCKFKIPGVTHWMIECNMSRDILDDNVAAGVVHQSLRNRIVQNHMDLQTVKDMLLANDLSQTREIWLLHLSNDNSDAERFRREIAEATGKVVYIA